jgi:hypothetical protein
MNIDPNQKPKNDCIEIDKVFLDKMVQKCEVSSYNEMYVKLVHQRGDVVRCDEVFDKDAKYSIEKIKCDVKPIKEVIFIKLFDPRKPTIESNVKNQPVSNPFNKLNYIVNEEGLKRVIFHYRQETFLSKEITLKNLIEIWEIQPEEVNKLKDMIQDLIKRKQIFGELKKGNTESDYILIFKSMLEIPGKRKKLTELILTVILFISLLIFLLIITRYL